MASLRLLRGVVQALFELLDAGQQAGHGPTDRVGDEVVGARKIHAMFELHIEQGPVLEDEGVTIGVVTGVQGISWTEYTVTGVSNHAGTTPMPIRKDAGVAMMRLYNDVMDKFPAVAGPRSVWTVGKMSIDAAVLKKKGKLDPAEREEMSRHPEYGWRILSSNPRLHMAAEIAYCHHERWDGSGYPGGLHGENIPLSARAVAVADVSAYLNQVA